MRSHWHTGVTKSNRRSQSHTGKLTIFSRVSGKERFTTWRFVLSIFFGCIQLIIPLSCCTLCQLFDSLEVAAVLNKTSRHCTWSNNAAVYSTKLGAFHVPVRISLCTGCILSRNITSLANAYYWKLSFFQHSLPTLLITTPNKQTTTLNDLYLPTLVADQLLHRNIWF